MSIYILEKGLAKYSQWNKSIQPATYVYILWDKDATYILKIVEKIRIIFCKVWKLHDIQISMSTNNVLLGQIHAVSFTYYLWLLLCYNSRVE